MLGKLFPSTTTKDEAGPAGQTTERNAGNQRQTPKRFLNKLAEWHDNELDALIRESEHILIKRLEEHFTDMSKQIKDFLNSEQTSDTSDSSTASAETPHEASSNSELDERPQVADDRVAPTITADQPSRDLEETAGNEGSSSGINRKSDVEVSARKKGKRKFSDSAPDPQPRKI